MALTTVIDGFITVAELRSEIGKPTLDTADPGYIADIELEKLIQRYHDDAVEMARRMADERLVTGQLPASRRVFSSVAIALSASVTQPRLLEGTIGTTYYPFVLQAQDNTGREYIFDDNPGKTVRTSFTQRYVYRLVGRQLYVSPGANTRPDPTTLNVHLALESDVWNFLFDGEMVRNYNALIITEASVMMDRIIKEGIRLEQIFQEDDGLIADLS